MTCEEFSENDIRVHIGVESSKVEHCWEASRCFPRPSPGICGGSTQVWKLHRRDGALPILLRARPHDRIKRGKCRRRRLLVDVGANGHLSPGWLRGCRVPDV